MRKLILFLFIGYFASSCSRISNKQGLPNDNTINLKERQIGKSRFYISLPKGYHLKETVGVDFYVYLFQSKDKDNQGAYTGGLYFGGHPNEIEAENKNCQTKSIEGDLLTQTVEWKLFDCKDKFEIQTIIELDNWEKVHAFGDAKTREDAQKLIQIFSTLREK